MATMRVFVVFILPVIFSISLGAVVLNGIVEQPGRELNMWQFGGEFSSSHGGGIVGIIGLSEEYSTLEPVEIALQFDHLPFDCGDLYITIYETASNTAIIQNGFFNQCFDTQGVINPVEFSEIVGTPGSYELSVEIISQELDVINGRGLFTVK